MTDNNAALANNTSLPESHLHYEFGTFNERLEHLCMLFEITPPEMVYEDDEPTLTEPLIDWIKASEVNMDWLFVGNPCEMLCEWAKRRGQERETLEIKVLLEPEVQAGMLAFLRSVVIHGVSMKEAEPVFAEVVREFRAQKPA
jgi:hypothetical protein